MSLLVGSFVRSLVSDVCFDFSKSASSIFMKFDTDVQRRTLLNSERSRSKFKVIGFVHNPPWRCQDVSKLIQKYVMLFRSGHCSGCVGSVKPEIFSVPFISRRDLNSRK